LGRNDLAFARRHAVMRCASHPVAVGEAATGLPELHATAQSASCLVGQVFQEERVHCALQTNVQVRDVALGQSDDVGAGEGEALEEACCVLRVSAKPVQRLCEDDVEAPVEGVAHQRLEPGAQERGA